MTTLLVQELKTELSHVFKMNLTARAHIGAFIPYLYIHNNPPGTFAFEIFKGVDLLFSYSFGTSEIVIETGVAGNYVHAFYPIIPDPMIQLESGTYTAKLSVVSDYSYSDNAFVGWIQQHEDIQNEMDYTPADDTENPLAMRVKIFKQGIL